MNILLFNNRIYGLTKGQYSPTSEVGKITKSTPMGSLDYPFNPPQLALGASGTFIARTIDREQKHMGPILEEAHKHKGTSFVEIYQNCNIFNDGAFSDLTEKETKAETQLVLEQGKPMTFGAENNKGLILDGSNFKVVKLGSDYNADDILKHDKEDKNLAMLLSEITYNPELPVPIGILYQETKSTYDDMMTNQIEEAKQKNESADLEKLFFGTNSWIVD
jgi:2-oxoglutarate ferredoxin oxidoreductase subunit beta